MRPNFYGRGAKFPLQLSSTGGVQEAEGAQKIEEAIRVILGTQYGERVMRPTFGCGLHSLLFAPNNDATANVARYYAEECLAKWEPRIEVFDVNVKNDNNQGALIICIVYQIKKNQDLRSLVYPFYLERTQS